MRTTLYILINFICCNLAIAQTAHQSLRVGDKNYQDENFQSAELMYRKANENESSLKSNFNLGNSLFQQERFEEAIEKYQIAVQKAKPGTESGKAYYNLGNAYFKNQDLEQAMEAYKQAIKEDPSNREARYNMYVCKEILKQQPPNPQSCDNPNQDGEQKENGEEKEQEEQQQNEQQQQQENQEQNEDQQENEEGEKEEKEQEESQVQEPTEGAFDSTRLEKQTLDSIDAAKLLQVIESEEQKVQERLKKYNSSRKRQEKDW